MAWSLLSQSRSEPLLEESLSDDWSSGSCADSKLVSGVSLFDSTSLVEGPLNLEMVVASTCRDDYLESSVQSGS